ncbi:hypothetical protein [Azospirillum sp. TSO22-1]|uniref:hypothetical protein n=1 Tax=Azospirillum sp. TSO22-1 TaxID=716789 RepID=UPI000D607450|nr:hypothetical protein [Azospirillum sp. TSO22-1]PWC44371.1 hypothetical protein TSO221_17785 [Azospirillum sp. TSO22-1]
MDTMTDARRQAGLELQALAQEFEASDEAAFHRTRILCWAVLAIAALIEMLLLIGGGDWRYLLASWIAIAGLTWFGYAVSTSRQRRQTARLRELALRWLGVDPPVV